MFKCENKSVVIMYKENKTELIDNYHKILHTINIIKAEKFIQGLKKFSRNTCAHKEFTKKKILYFLSIFYADSE